MQKNTRKRQLNNDGFSLVELMIAIVILSIIVIPLLHSFVTAARTNAKARNTMHATAIAEDVMENFEAYALEDITQKYMEQGYTVKDSAGHDMDADGDGKLDSQIQGSWILSGTNVGTTSGEYDVKIELDSGAYTEINEQKILKLEDLTGSCNAVYQDGEDEALEAYQHFAMSVLGKTAQEMQDSGIAATAVQSIAPYVTRTLTFSIDTKRISLDVNGASVETDVYTVTSSNLYRYEYGGKVDVYPQGGNNQVIFDNETALKKQAAKGIAAESRISNIVICLQPRCESGDASRITDQVIVYNPHNVEAKVFLVKQNLSAERADAFSPDDKNNYIVGFELQENWPTWVTGPEMTACHLRTNLLVQDPDNSFDTTYKNNVYKFRNLSPALAGYEGKGYLNPDSGKKKTDPDFLLGEPGGIKALQIMDGDDLTPEESGDRLYDITVQVYVKGTADTGSPVITMTGTVVK